MKLTIEEFKLILMTPCFSGTAEGRYSDTSVFRIPPVRGHVRWWHRQAFGRDSENTVWGAISDETARSSRVGLRLDAEPKPCNKREPTLPHKERDQAQRPAFSAGTVATIVLQRLPNCTGEDWSRACSAMKLWLVAGCYGNRSNRAAGSVWPTDADWTPKCQKTLQIHLGQLTKIAKTPWSAALIGYSIGSDFVTLRKTASDTINEPELFGEAITDRPRSPSPIRFKVVLLDGNYALLALAPTRRLLERAETELNSKPLWKALGGWSFL